MPGGSAVLFGAAETARTRVTRMGCVATGLNGVVELRNSGSPRRTWNIGKVETSDEAVR